MLNIKCNLICRDAEFTYQFEINDTESVIATISVEEAEERLNRLIYENEQLFNDQYGCVTLAA